MKRRVTPKPSPAKIRRMEKTRRFLFVIISYGDASGDIKD
jgi:hypothetical protein